MSDYLKKTHTLVECACMVALSVALSFIVLWYMPLGGAVTLAGMLPICLISVRHGARWGIPAAAVFALFQLFIGIVRDGLLGWGLTPWMLLACVGFDYFFAYGVLGLSGILRRHGEGGVYVGTILSFLLSFLCHFVSGVVVFRFFDQFELFGKFFSRAPALYSLCYNGLYMAPELTLTLVAMIVLMRIPYVRRLLLAQ